MKQRLDQHLVSSGRVTTRSQSESYIRLGKVKVNGHIQTKTAYSVHNDDTVQLLVEQQYVSRAGLKLASVAPMLSLEFKDKVILDVGSSTGGFTDFSLRQGARKVIAVDVGTNQLHPSLRTNPLVELHEQTDIRDMGKLSSPALIVVIDVSFISLREVLPAVARLSSTTTKIVAMVKPQFEAGNKLKNKGVIKNDTMRREILKQFELWAKQYFIIINKADSAVAGSRGNRERFYLLQKSL